MMWVVLGTSQGAARDAIMAAYPRHKEFVDGLPQEDIVEMGPFSDGGNLGIFRTRETAEAFATGDPFRREGFVTYAVKEWSADL